MSAAVVDENVPIVANDATRAANGLPVLAPHASDACRLRVVRYLRDLIATGTVVIDDAGLCIALYRKYLSGRGQPGTGDAFLRHIFDHAYNATKVERVVLEQEGGSFAAFPRSDGLRTFDRSDRVWVALALSSTLTPVIVNAVDSDYEQHADSLREAGVQVLELCNATAIAPKPTPTRGPRRRRGHRQ